MPESESSETKEVQTIVARPRSSGPNAIAVIALIVAVVSLLLNAYLIGAVQSSDDTIRDLQSDVSDQRNTADTLNSAISDLESTVADLESQISDQENDIDDLQTQVSDLEQTVGDLEQRISDLEQTVVDLEQRISDLEGPGAPVVAMITSPTAKGYELEIAGVSRPENLDAYKVTVVKDLIPWAVFPKILVDGVIGTGPAGEYLNFTDLTGDGKLTGGDFFTLENLTSGSQYEVILLWAADDSKITSETINVP